MTKTLTTQEVKEKVRKLFALAMNAGATEAEAALAGEKAQALLEEYKLSQVDCAEAEQEKTEHQQRPQGARPPHWRRVLRKACADTTFCFSMSGGSDKLWHLFGKATDTMVCVELYGFLAEQIERLGREFTRSNHSHRLYPRAPERAGASQFRTGCASRVASRLREAFKAREAVAVGTGIVIYDDSKAACALSRTIFPHQSTSRKRRCSVTGAYAAGQAAGNNVRLHTERKLPPVRARFLLA
jgi:hypothetical protein